MSELPMFQHSLPIRPPLCLALLLAACGETTIPVDVADLDPIEVVKPDIPALESATRPSLDQLSFGGLQSYEDADAFIQKIRKLGGDKDRRGIADMVAYPFTTFKNGKSDKTYKTKTELLVDIDKLLPDQTLNDMAMTTYDDLILNWQGGALASGRIWFNRYDADMKIFRIH